MPSKRLVFTLQKMADLQARSAAQSETLCLKWHRRVPSFNGLLLALMQCLHWYNAASSGASTERKLGVT